MMQMRTRVRQLVAGDSSGMALFAPGLRKRMMIQICARACARISPARLAGVKALALATVAVVVGTAAIARGANPSHSKLAPHLLVTYTSGCQQMIQQHPKVIKILGTGGGMMTAAQEYKTGTPGGLIVLRIYTPISYNEGQDPAWAANNYWTNYLAPPINSLSPSQKALIDYVEGPNEGDNTPTWGSVSQAQWYNTFWLNLAPLIANAGFKPLAFSISVGNPPGDPAYVNTMIDTIVPALRLCKQLGGGWSYHSYTLPYSQDVNTEIWYSLRYRQYYARFATNYPDLNDLPLIMTEGGVDGQAVPGGPGWKAYSQTQYENWLLWFDQRIMEDPYVLGCTLFQSGDFGQWFSFELDPVAGWISNRLATATPPGPVINLTPTSLTTSTVQGSSPPNQSFTVSNTGNGTLSYSITDNVSWLNCSPTSGTSTGEADTITVIYSASGLGVGTYNATITVSDPAASNNPQTVGVTLTVTASGTTVAEDFESMPSWTSSFDAPWGNAATWSIVGGGQSGNALQAQRTGTGSSQKAKVYNISASTNYTISIYIKCPSSSSYWAETAFKLGSFTAQDFDANGGTWTMIKKFDAATNGNGNVWTQYAINFNSGSNSQISVGYKLGSSSGNGPVVQWDTLRVVASTGSPTITRSPSTLSPTAAEGSNPSNQTFTVQNTGSGTLNYSITDNAQWVSVSPSSGTSTTEVDTMTVSYNTTGLGVGTYNATITISDPAATNNPQTIAVTMTLTKKTVAEDFNALPTWNSSFDAGWGGAASWSVVSGGQAGNCLQATRSNTGSSSKVKVYNITSNQSYTISVYMRCPSSGNAYWRECFYKLGNFTAQDYDQNGGTWTEVKKFANPGTNGNGDAWVQYSKTFNSGSSTQISVGFKTGNSGGTAPTIKWDTLRVQ